MVQPLCRLDVLLRPVPSAWRGSQSGATRRSQGPAGLALQRRICPSSSLACWERGIAEPRGSNTWNSAPGCLGRDSPSGVTTLAGVWACLEVHRPEAGTPSFPPASHSHGCGPSLHTGRASHDLNSALPPKASSLGGGGSRPCPSAIPPLAHGTCPRPTLCLRAGFIHRAVDLPLGGLVTESFPWVSGSSGPKYRAV